MIKCLRSAHTEFIEDMIIRAAGQYTCFLDSHLLNYAEVFFLCPDPCCDLRKLKSKFLTCPDSSLIPVTVGKELCLPDDAFRPGQS